MPILRRFSNTDTPGCEFCIMMQGAVFREGSEPPPYPLSNYGVPAHKHCTCQYLRFNILVTEDSDFLLTEDGRSLCHTTELVPVEMSGVPDLPDWKATKPATRSLPKKAPKSLGGGAF